VAAMVSATETGTDVVAQPDKTTMAAERKIERRLIRKDGI
jgi:hypothetical protein